MFSSNAKVKKNVTQVQLQDLRGLWLQLIWQRSCDRIWIAWGVCFFFLLVKLVCYKLPCLAIIKFFFQFINLAEVFRNKWTCLRQTNNTGRTPASHLPQVRGTKLQCLPARCHWSFTVLRNSSPHWGFGKDLLYTVLGDMLLTAE